MTHSGGKPHTNVGDRGQRYEVSYLDPEDNTRKVMGWVDNDEGSQAMMKSINLHPSMETPEVRDRWVGGNR